MYPWKKWKKKKMEKICNCGRKIYFGKTCGNISCNAMDLLKDVKEKLNKEHEIKYG